MNNIRFITPKLWEERPDTHTNGAYDYKDVSWSKYYVVEPLSNQKLKDVKPSAYLGRGCMIGISGPWTNSVITRPYVSEKK